MHLPASASAPSNQRRMSMKTINQSLHRGLRRCLTARVPSTQSSCGGIYKQGPSKGGHLNVVAENVRRTESGYYRVCLLAASHCRDYRLRTRTPCYHSTTEATAQYTYTYISSKMVLHICKSFLYCWPMLDLFAQIWKLSD